MAQPAYKFIDKRASANGWQQNLLIPGATQTPDRQNIPRLDFDVHRNVSALGRRVLLSAGRRLYAGNSIVRAAINEIATYSVSMYQPQFYGQNTVWGGGAEEWLEENNLFCDLRGPPYSMDTLRRNIVLCVCREGDIGVVLTEDATGSPKIQLIPSHRIGPWNQYNMRIVQGGPYDGARMIDGVIVDDYGAALAYRVMGENPYDDATYTDISARSMFLVFIPDYPDQVRGFSLVSSGLFDWQDIAETKFFERIAQKVGAGVLLLNKTESGDIDTAKAVVTPGNIPPGTDGSAKSVVLEEYGGGMVRHLKTREDVEAFRNDRPSPDARQFWESCTRECLAGMGWSYDFTVKAEVGGAALRLIVEKLNATKADMQTFVAYPSCRRIDGYRIAKAIKNGRLEQDPDWWKWRYQGPADITSDSKYDSDVDLQENRAGYRTMQSITASRGAGRWERVQDQLIKEEKRLQTECKKEQVDPERIRNMAINGQKSGSAQPAMGATEASAEAGGDKGGTRPNPENDQASE